MAPISAAILLAAAAAALMAVALQLSVAAAVAASPPAPVGRPGCSTTCGNVSVPYPFGFGPSRCYCVTGAGDHTPEEEDIEREA